MDRPSTGLITAVATAGLLAALSLVSSGVNLFTAQPVEGNAPFLCLEKVLYQRLKRQSSPASGGKEPWLSNGASGVKQDGILGLIGNTPLIRINTLSDATGCEVLNQQSFS